MLLFRQAHGRAGGIIRGIKVRGRRRRQCIPAGKGGQAQTRDEGDWSTLSKQGMEAHLLKMVIVRESFDDPLLSHDQEGGTVGQAPVLVNSIIEKLGGGPELIARLRNDRDAFIRAEPGSKRRRRAAQGGTARTEIVHELRQNHFGGDDSAGSIRRLETTGSLVERVSGIEQGNPEPGVRERVAQSILTRIAVPMMLEVPSQVRGEPGPFRVRHTRRDSIGKVGQA